MNYAPVIIPTLCRFKHLKDCLESLDRCTGSEHTEVFIGLDYPSKKNHWEGYNLIKNYLNITSFKFKSLHVIAREKNYGFGPNGNFSLLRKHVLENFDRVICTEDDNVFSPCFLEYINKGLECFANDESVLAINGYRHFYPLLTDKGSFLRQNVDFSAWGYGIWKDRMQDLEQLCNPAWFKDRLNINSFFSVRKSNGNLRAYQFLTNAFRQTVSLEDNTYSVYMALTKKDVVMPSVSLVRNLGWDGSGEHCHGCNETDNVHLTQQISSDSVFEYEGDNSCYYTENNQRFVNYSYGRISNFELIHIISKNIFGRLLKFFKK